MTEKCGLTIYLNTPTKEKLANADFIVETLAQHFSNYIDYKLGMTLKIDGFGSQIEAQT